MNSKIKAILTVVLAIVVVSTTAVFAKSNTDESNQEQNEGSVLGSMFDAMRDWSRRAQENGSISQEEADRLEQHFKDMERYHQENGLGHCGRQSNGAGTPENQNYMPGFRRGMMRRAL